MTIVAIVCVTLIAVGAVLALVRVERGPSMLDRTVGLDVFTAALVGAIAIEAAYSQRVETVPLLVVLSLVGFVSSVTISRFAAVEPQGEGRVRTAEEIAAEDAERMAEQEREREMLRDSDQDGGRPDGVVR
ncbi:monovalent cation/H+ antiporter complex subunit F [Paraoerskovia marina]|uniref:Multisubunit sodium/proton antiporter, MrpF subunit n=1 Tax=Paraoerskovia marina TaxID=545619 RepID=A0A1H1LWN4_9CELL|nr:monovalent cation/H+ antiporter complex subunit F [Paraoerskovia marina]SDR78672.1 multisubunit sodium/proton antiporter, MrpF subunit [Paraoerskovia marina]